MKISPLNIQVYHSNGQVEFTEKKNVVYAGQSLIKMEMGYGTAG